MMFILLDIDGVMVTTPPWKQVDLLNDNFSNFNSKAALNLKEIISETGATIVLTTSHKFRFNMAEWKNIFKTRGIPVTSLKRLNKSANGISRKEEILTWLNTDDNASQSFVIIDDDKSLNDLPLHIKNKCVITSAMLGLNDEAMSNVFEILEAGKLAHSV